MNQQFSTNRSYFLIIALASICTFAAHAVTRIGFFGIAFQAVLEKFLARSPNAGRNYEKKWQKYYARHAEIMNSSEKLVKFFKKSIENNVYLTEYFDYPENFMFGLSSSHYQIEGGIGDECACHRFYEKNDKALPGKAADFWNRYEKFIEDITYFGGKTFRMSVSWERIFPTGPDNPNLEALHHYREIIQAFKNAGIEPLVVLHHYTVPTWFEDKGGFAYKKNIKHFVDFAKTVYAKLYDIVRFWSTFNAIEGYAFKGYQRGESAPGETNNLQKTCNVMGNMLVAHVEIYEALKEAYKNLLAKNSTINEPLIGIQKNVLPLEPANNSTIAGQIKAHLASKIGNMLQNEGFYGFFTTGIFELYIPNKVYTYRYKKSAPRCIDWIGINFYSNKYVMNLEGQSPPETDPDRETLNPNYRFYPEGLARATEEIYNRIVVPVSKAQGLEREIPIWITENGIAAKTEEQRTLFFQRTLFTIGCMINRGYPIVAYTPWASHDNFEWGAELGTKRYGMFDIDFDNLDACYAKSSEQRLKQGAQFFRSFVQKFYSTENQPLTA